MSSATAHVSSNAMEKSEGSRLRSNASTGKSGLVSAASMLALKLEYVPTRYVIEESAGRLVMTCGVSPPTPLQQPHSCSSGITHPPLVCALICHHPCEAQKFRSPGDWDRYRSVEFPVG